MASGFGESTRRSTPSPSCSCNNNNSDAGNFECNICFDLAQDPIITLCGHLFCWPCLYKWLHFHSQSGECLVCKALIEEKKLIPLYGRGKTSTDPRSKSITGVNIPHRPAGQRPETAPPLEPNPFFQHGFGGFTGGLGGFAPATTTRFGNFTLSTAFGGLIPSFFNFHLHGLHDVTMYGGGAGIPYGFAFHNGHVHRYSHTGQGDQDYYLKRLSLFIFFFLLSLLLFGNRLDKVQNGNSQNQASALINLLREITKRGQGSSPYIHIERGILTLICLIILVGIMSVYNIQTP